MKNDITTESSKWNTISSSNTDYHYQEHTGLKDSKNILESSIKHVYTSTTRKENRRQEKTNSLERVCQRDRELVLTCPFQKRVNGIQIPR